MTRKSVIFNAHIVDYCTDVYGALFFSDGKIDRVVPYGAADTDAGGMPQFRDSALQACFDGCSEKTDAHGLTVMPAFVDMHSHFRYPGQTEKEDLSSGLHAAAAGGFGTLVLMPNTNPVVSSAESALEIGRLARTVTDASGAVPLADVLQTVSITKDFSGADISHLDGVCRAAEMAKKAGSPIPVPVITEDGRDVAADSVLFAAMKKCAQAGIIVSCHSEENMLVMPAKEARLARDFAKAEKILADAENNATMRNLMLAITAQCNVHIAHVSTKTAIAAVRAAKKCLSAQRDCDAGAAGNGSRMAGETPAFSVTCEVTPHHLGLSNKMPGLECELVNPPLRSEEDRQAVIAALLDGTADMIATDHAPHTAADKAAGAPGFTGLETAFAVCNTELVASGLMPLMRLSALMSYNPACRLQLNCGSFAPGKAADIVCVDPQAVVTVEPEHFYSKGKYTPLAGKTLKGRIESVYHRGVCVYKNQEK